MERSGSNSVDVTARVRALDGTIEIFHLRIHNADPFPEVEETGGRLPRWCPDRHINDRGRFCLSWSATPQVIDGDDARRDWWETVRGFLALQLVADGARRWQRSKQWAHGAAAPIQHAFEQHALRVPAPLVAAVCADLVAITKDGHVENRRRPCPCGSGVRVKSCHEDDLVALSRLRTEQHAAERAFWNQNSARECCNTMDTCPLTNRPTV